MTRLWPAGLLLLAGCAGGDGLALRQLFEDRQETALVPEGPSGPVLRVAARQPGPPAAPDIAVRVAMLGDRVAQANPALGLRPRCCTQSSSIERISHQGTDFIYITDALVKRCATEGQLAAVLAHEIGRMVVEREAIAPPETRQPEVREPQEVPVGTDAGGPFGPADGTRLVELAKYEQQRRRPGVTPPLPSAAVIARDLLQRAGYDPDELSDVTALLHAAEGQRLNR
jgi:predicted Zn-dependent protease